MSFIVRLAKLTQPDLVARAGATKLPQLVVIPYSHYCDLAMWVLKDVPHVEYSFPPGLHVLPVLRLRVGGSKKNVSKSSAMFSGKKAAHAAGGTLTAVPVCALPDGRVLVDSWQIADEFLQQAGWSDDGLDEQLRDMLDRKIGPNSRALAYYYLFKPELSSQLYRLVTDGTGFVFRTFFWFSQPGFARRLTKMLKLDDAKVVQQIKDSLHADFAQLGTLLEALPTPFIAGQKPGLADVALATMAAPAVLPDLYCGGRYKECFDQVYLHPDVRPEIDGYRNTAVGRHTLLVYKAMRLAKTSQ